MKILKTYFLNCSLLGLPYIADSRFHWTERLYWIINVILTWGGCIYIMYTAYGQFENSAISFTVSTSYLDFQTNFPAVVICEKGNEKYKYYSNKLLGERSDYSTDELLKQIVFFSGSLPSSSSFCDSEECILFSGNYSFYSEKVRSSCHELLSYCSWNNVTFECCDEVRSMHTAYGVCYGINTLVGSFNSNVTNHVTMDVSLNSSLGVLTVEITNTDIQLMVLSRESIPLALDQTGVILDGKLDTRRKNKEINVFLSVKETENEKEVRDTGIERRDCRFPDENYLKTSNIYSYSACIVECTVKLQNDLCGCIHHLMPPVDKVKICDNLEELHCLTNGLENLTAGTARCECDNSCVEMETKVVGIIAEKNFLGFSNPESVIKLNMMLPAPTVKYIRKVVNGQLDLIVYLGGTAGLFIGASLLTVVEVFYYFLVRPWGDYKKQQRRKAPQLKPRESYKNVKKVKLSFINLNIQ